MPIGMWFFLCGLVVANFETFDDQMALVANVDQRRPAFGRSEAAAVDDGRFAGITLEGDHIAGRARHVDRHLFVVDAAAHIDGAARPDRVGRFLDRAPRPIECAGIGVVAVGRHVIGLRARRGIRSRADCGGTINAAAINSSNATASRSQLDSVSCPASCRVV